MAEETQRERSSERTTAAAPVPETTAGAPQSDDAMEALRADLEQVAANSGVRMSIVVKDLGATFGGREIGINKDAAFQSASLI